jgi:hypothetical protein
MLRIFRNAMVGGAAVVTLFAGTATADTNWTITVNNKSKTPADVTILLNGSKVGDKKSAGAGGSTTISIPPKSGNYTWKAESGGKECGKGAGSISGNRSIDVTCEVINAAGSGSGSGSGSAAGSGSGSGKPAETQNQPKQEKFFTFTVTNNSSSILDVSVVDWNQGQKEVYRGTLDPSKSASGREKAKATIPRPTTTDFETNLHWKVVAKVDEDGKPAKETTPKPRLPGEPEPKQTSKPPLTWCGETNTHSDGQTITVGLKESGAGKSC